MTPQGLSRPKEAGLGGRPQAKVGERFWKWLIPVHFCNIPLKLLQRLSWCQIRKMH